MPGPLPIVASDLHGEDVHDRIVEEAIEAILSTVDMTSVLERTGKLLNRRFGETRVAIHRLLEAEPGRAEVALVSDPLEPGAAVGARFALQGTASGAAVASRAPVVVDPLSASQPRYADEPALVKLGYGSLVSFPLVFEDQVLGTLDIAHPPREGLLACCFQVARQVAHLVAMALHNSLMVEEVRRLARLLDRENRRLKEELREIRKAGRYVADSPAMAEVISRIRLVAASDTSVLVRGETGTGKEGLARLVHDLSPRFGGPFVVVNLGAIPDTLIESELFGHERGAFTGAEKRRAGRFEQAEGGTLFLDEVGDAPPAVQVRLLRVLQEREVQRVGGSASVKVDVRIVAATNRDLEKMVAEGTFRQDLYYRLAVFPVVLPPLRDRREDLRPLVEHLLARHAAAMNRRAPAIPDPAWAALAAHRWPGNVRELENFLQRALILSPGPELALPPLPAGGGPPRTAAFPLPPGRFDEPCRFDDAVRGVIERALRAAEGRVYGPQGAAALLGLKPTTLQGKMRKLGMARTAREPPGEAQGHGEA